MTAKALALALALTLVSAPALAQDATPPTGDAAAGEATFRQCISCHVAVDAEGNTLAGRSGRTGPNLYGIAGRPAGSIEDFRYSPALLAAGEKGLVWDEASFAAYVQDPAAFLKEYLEDGSARSNMTFRVRKAEDAANLYAYLVSLGPVEAPASN